MVTRPLRHLISCRDVEMNRLIQLQMEGSAS
jgi:hypothetical protein